MLPPQVQEVPPEALRFRESEFKRLHDWIEQGMVPKKAKPVAIYVSGAPGTGKTATVLRVLSSVKSRVRIALVNCVSAMTARPLVQKIEQQLGTSKGPKGSTATIDARLQHVLDADERPVLLVLDEVDHLRSAGASANRFLYSVFEWPHTFPAKLMVLAIANSIDLTTRVLPKLAAGKRPRTLVFEAYTSTQLSQILVENTPAALVPQNQPDARKAVELCARKVAAASGDMRQALMVLRSAASRNNRNPTSSSNAKDDDGGTPPPPPFMPSCASVLDTFKDVYASPLARARLPYGPRLLLAVILRCSQKGANLTVQTATAAYLRACTLLNERPLDSTELKEAFATLDAQSFISHLPTDGTIRLLVDAQVARSAIADTAIIRELETLNPR